MKYFLRTVLFCVLQIALSLCAVSAQVPAPVSGDASKVAVKAKTESSPSPGKVTEDASKALDDTEKTKTSESEYPEAISDNSFLIEEAYNQEPGVMQTISTCAWFRRSQNDVACTVTQEFPVVSQKHQLSYTLPFSFLDSNRVSGPGDVMFNYRYQLTGEKDWAVVAPRISLVLPTGSFGRDLGTGATGLQFNLPVSKRLSRDFVAHFNAGATHLWKAKGMKLDGAIVRRDLTNYNVGGSVIWLARKRFNLVFEYLENFSSEIDGSGKVQRFNEHIVNPGVRFAFDFGPLQVVPGVSVPTSVVGNQTRTGVFFYLSLEHPFKKTR